MAEIGITEVTAVAQDAIASVVQEVLKQKSILLPTISDYSSYAVKGDKSVSIPKRTQFAAADKSENTNLTAQELTFTADQILLNKHKAIYAKLERIAGVQAMVQVDQEIISEMANELALQIDKDILVQLKLASTAAPDHLLDYANTPTDTVQAVDILEARRLLNVQKVPMMDRYMLISPDQEKAMLQIANFIEVDKYGADAVALKNGELGRIYGFTVLMHTELAAAQTLFWHSTACGFARQLQPEYATDFQLASVSQEYLLHNLYGVKVLDAGVRQVYFNGTGS
jgi:N4-gp56 family major capsid protein